MEEKDKHKKESPEFRYTIKDVPWPVWISIAIGIICLLLIIFLSPPLAVIARSEAEPVPTKVGKAISCSIVGLFFGLLMGTLDYTNKTVIKRIDKHFTASASEHHKMIETLEKMMQVLEKIATSLPPLK